MPIMTVVEMLHLEKIMCLVNGWLEFFFIVTLGRHGRVCFDIGQGLYTILQVACRADSTAGSGPMSSKPKVNSNLWLAAGRLDRRRTRGADKLHRQEHVTFDDSRRISAGRK
jgi:hypothetical protein